MMRISAAVLSLTVTARPCVAFEADGFRNGDSIESIERALASEGLPSKPRVKLGDMKNAYSIGSGRLWFSFCEDKLFGYDREFDTSISSVGEMLKGAIERGGAPKVEGRLVGHRERGIWFTWMRGREEFVLILAQDEKGKLIVTRRHEDPGLKARCAKQ
jgi:hypothetical protein